MDVAPPCPKAPRPEAPTAAEFPGCTPVRLPREELDDCELRFEYWDAVSETAWVCEPVSPYHESPARCLTGLVTLIARMRGAPIRCFGHMDLLHRDRRGEPQMARGIAVGADFPGVPGFAGLPVRVIAAAAAACTSQADFRERLRR